MEQQVEPQPSTPVGLLLRNCRLRAGLDLTEVAQTLRIRQRFLEAIESGRLEALPAPVYALGFVRSYAEQLGLDAEEIARRFKIEIANLGAGAPLHFPLPIPAESGTPKAAVLLLGAMIAVGAYAAWYTTSRYRVEVADIVSPVPDRLEQLLDEPEVPSPMSGSSSSKMDRAPAGNFAPTAPVAPRPAPSGDIASAALSGFAGSAAGRDGDSLNPTAPTSPLPPNAPASTQTMTGGEPAATGTGAGSREPASTAGPQTGGQSAVTAMAAEPVNGVGPLTGDVAGRIVLEARADSWVEVRDSESNAMLLARLLKMGDVYRIPDKPRLKLTTGNAGGLVVLVDGQVVPPLGKDGTVRRGISLDPESLRKGTEGLSAR